MIAPDTMPNEPPDAVGGAAPVLDEPAVQADAAPPADSAASLLQPDAVKPESEVCSLGCGAGKRAGFANNSNDPSFACAVGPFLCLLCCRSTPDNFRLLHFIVSSMLAGCVAVFRPCSAISAPCSCTPRGHFAWGALCQRFARSLSQEEPALPLEQVPDASVVGTSMQLSY